MGVRGEGEQAIWLNFGNKFLLLFSVWLARKCVWECVCELDVWSCARLGSCQKSTQTSTLRSDKNTSSHTDILTSTARTHVHTHTHTRTHTRTHALIKSAFGHMLKMSKSRQHVLCKACCHSHYLHYLPPIRLHLCLCLYLDIFL